MQFNLKKFYRFCSALRIETKEIGMMSLAYESLLGTQTYVMDEIAKGLEEDKHFFVILKGRQLGITTISLALDLYWHFIHPGLQGTMTTDTEENKDMFRSTLSMYMEGLPREWKIPVIAHNRNQLSLRNRSRFFYQVAGTKKKGGLGRGKAITYLHGTETSSWGDEEGLASLLASLAETNPMRLYLFESTARGFNMFHDMYVTARRARTQRAIFCGWWRNQLYSADPESAVYKTYWDGRLKPEEKEWVKDIKKLYGVDINSRQMAWWRWKLGEGIKDEALMFQEFPPTEDYAFIMSGSNFFSNSRCTDAAKDAKKTAPDYYRYAFGTLFQDTEVIRSNEKNATLKVWEEPDDKGHYVIGADPAYGSSDWADRFSVCVMRCFADGMEQVAEFNTSDLNQFQFAWVICHLAGAYRGSVLNLEVNGPGQTVINEIRTLKRQAASMAGPMGRGLMDVLGNMSNYLWRKNDSMSGPGNSIGWITSVATKERMMTYFKDYFERGMCHLNSIELLEEMKGIVREDGTIAAPGRGKDDRVIAAALASAAFAEQMQHKLIAMHLTRKVAVEQENYSAQDVAASRSVGDYLKKIGMHGK